ncbi:stalk domain-containing protein [Alkaliphilus peptidifermentans]|uniref:Repeat domain (List_Bact_rpt) n=1 Tax=Alkaliphilus peptidifermentans DSM 18978 TaxID=1120976 RepID=A0A1G5FE88_9FIRM|nr:stalk domain-containing protein [Alkaliphilus peptidifermentans]SCY37565.1 repeat domain (List_Bact_rpt) [Alkaliphilus peptidifermentans DSM 18978]
MMKQRKCIIGLLTILLVFNIMSVSTVEATWPATSWQDSGVPDTTWYTTQTAEGKGSEANPYIIATAEELAGLAALVNSETSFANKYIRLANDINLAGKNWVMIGTNERRFVGHFDGNGHVISNLTSYSNNYEWAGLFGWVGTGNANVSIKNLGVVDINMEGKVRGAGGLVAYLTITNFRSTVIENCFTSGRIHSSAELARIGGLIGEVYISNAGNASLTIANSYSTMDIALTSTDNGISNIRYAGGLIGSLEYIGVNNNVPVTINNSYSATKLTTVNITRSRIGGFAGYVNTENQVHINNSIFDIQASAVSYAFHQTSASFAGVTSKTTSEMTGSSLTAGWDSDIWQAEEGFYPRLKVFNTVPGSVSRDSSLVSAIPLFLFENTTSPFLSDTSINVRRSFTVPVNGVTWTAEPSGILGFDGAGNVAFTSPGTDTNVTVTAQLSSGIKKKFVILCKSGVDPEDTIPPTISIGTITPSDFSVNISVSSDEFAEIYVLVKEASETAPSNANGIVSNNRTVKGTGTEYNALVGGLEHSTDYISYAIGIDATGNVSSIISGEFTTLQDATPPAWTGNTGVTISGKEARFRVSFNEEGTIKYVVLPDNFTAPSKEQVADGKDANNEAAYYYESNPYPTAGTSQNNVIDFSGFGAGYYRIYIICEDAYGNISNVVSSGTLRFYVKSSANDIIDFAVDGQIGAPEIDAVNHSVYFDIPNGTNITALEPIITVSAGATISPASGEPRDFSSPVTYTVTAEDNTPQNWEVTCYEVNLNSVTIETQPKLEYTEGEALDLSGLKVKLHWSNSTEEEIEYTDFTVKGLTVDKVDGTILTIGDNGSKMIITHISGSSVETNALIVNIAVVHNVTIETQPKLEYTAGEELDLSGLKVKLHWSNGTEEEVVFANFTAKGLTVDKANGTGLTYEDNSIKITITHTSEKSVETNGLIVHAAVNSITIETQPKLEYTDGEELDLSGLKVKLHWSNGIVEEVVFADFTTKGLTVDKANGTGLTYEDNSIKITITHTSEKSIETNGLIVHAAVNSITIETQPKLEYTEGEALDLSGLKVKLHWSNSTEEEIEYADFTGNGLTVDKTDGTILTIGDNGSKITITHTSGSRIETNTIIVNAIPTYTVTFIDWNGDILETEIVTEGNSATPPANPSRPGYIFNGWDKDFSNVTSNLTITAQYIEDLPTITDQEKVSIDKAALSIGFAVGDSANSVTEDIRLTTIGAMYGSGISWTSNNKNIIKINTSGDIGLVTRPTSGSGDAQVTVTAAVYNKGASDVRDFSLIVLQLQPPASQKVTISITKTDITTGGNNGSITITAYGGSGSYEYSNDNGSTWQDSNIFRDLIAGTYRVIARDSLETSNISEVNTVTIIKSGGSSDEGSGGSSSSGGGSSSGSIIQNLKITDKTPEKSIVGEAYSYRITATGGSGGYSFEVTSGTLPEGLTLSKEGVISGIPTKGGTYKYTITVTDKNGRVSKESFIQIIEEKTEAVQQEEPTGEPIKEEETIAPKIHILLTIGESEIKIDNEAYLLDATPFIDVASNRTLVPIRFISEALGAEVIWLSETRQVIIKDGEKEILLTIDSKEVLVNGEAIMIDCEAAILPPGRTYAPLRFICEALGATVEYDPETREIMIVK